MKTEVALRTWKTGYFNIAQERHRNGENMIFWISPAYNSQRSPKPEHNVRYLDKESMCSIFLKGGTAVSNWQVVAQGEMLLEKLYQNNKNDIEILGVKNGTTYDQFTAFVYDTLLAGDLNQLTWNFTEDAMPYIVLKPRRDGRKISGPNREHWSIDIREF